MINLGLASQMDILKVNFIKIVVEKFAVERMVSIGKEVLAQQGGLSDSARLGFHWPPFHTISHLHLHVISPEEEMGFIARGIFKKDSFWFVSVRNFFFLFN